MTTRSREAALQPRDFELLLEGARRIEKDRQRTEARFAVLVMGRLGLRTGELVHLTEDWIDWRAQRIRVPRQRDCGLGRGDGPCGYCKQAAEQMVETYEDRGTDDMPRARERFLNRHLEGGFSRGDALRLPEALELRWFAKTDAAQREIPFGHDPRVAIAMERFFGLPDRDAWGMSKSALNRRLDRALENADELDTDSTHPHGLRATAATHMSNQSLDAVSLKSVMGWASFQTAKSYLAESTDRAERAMQRMSTI